MNQYPTGQPGQAGTGLPAQQTSSAANKFDWSSRKSSTPSAPPSGTTSTGQNTFGWPSQQNFNNGQRSINSAPTTQPPSLTPAYFPPTQPQPTQPSSITPNNATTTAPIGSSYQYAPPPVMHGPVVVAAPTGSLLDRAKDNDKQALETLFGQFIPQGEQFVDSQYLGVLGLWGLGTHSFASLTANRIASIRVSIFGNVLYQDGSLESINSSALYQPSLLLLYIWSAATLFFSLILGLMSGLAIGGVAGLLVALTWVLLGILCLPLVAKLFYRYKKSGLVLAVREGISVYIFIDRKRMGNAKRFYRLFCDQREERLRVVGQP